MVAVSCAQKMGKLFLELSLAKVCSLSLPLSLPLSPPPPPPPPPPLPLPLPLSLSISWESCILSTEGLQDSRVVVVKAESFLRKVVGSVGLKLSTWLINDWWMYVTLDLLSDLRIFQWLLKAWSCSKKCFQVVKRWRGATHGAHGHGSELESPVNDKIGRSISKPSKWHKQTTMVVSCCIMLYHPQRPRYPPLSGRYLRLCNHGRGNLPKVDDGSKTSVQRPTSKSSRLSCQKLWDVSAEGLVSSFHLTFRSFRLGMVGECQMFLHLFARLHMECILQACAFHRHCELWSLLVPSFFTLRFGVTSTPKDTWQGFPSWSHELLQAMQEKTTTLETFDAVLGLHLAISTISRPFLCTSGDLQIASQTGTTLQRRIRSQFGIGL